jgi:hypothetical protein
MNVSHDGKSALTLPPVTSIRSRLGAIWGGRYAEDLLDVDDVAGPIHTSGLVQRPADVGTSTRRAFLSINGRAVRDAGIARAVEAAFRSTIVAVGLHIYAITGSTFAVSLVGAFALLPMIVFGLYGGMLADAFDRRLVLLVAAVVAWGSTITLAALAWTGVDTPSGRSTCSRRSTRSPRR